MTSQNVILNKNDHLQGFFSLQFCNIEKNSKKLYIFNGILGEKISIIFPKLWPKKIKE
jgi:hypothetical protein